MGKQPSLIKKFKCPGCAKRFELAKLLEHVEQGRCKCKRRASEQLTKLLRRRNHRAPAARVLEAELQEILGGAIIQ